MFRLNVRDQRENLQLCLEAELTPRSSWTTVRVHLRLNLPLNNEQDPLLPEPATEGGNLKVACPHIWKLLTLKSTATRSAAKQKQ